MDALCERLNSSLKDIEHEAFKDVVKVDIDVKLLGDEQVVIISDINRATLILETSSGEKRKRKVIVKVEPSSGPGKLMAKEFGVFEIETVMYSNILKSMEKLMSEKGDTDKLWADCLYSSDHKFIFQDLCEVGYKVVPTHQFLDFDHTVLVMKGLGKFHGLSMVMNERNMLDKSELKPYIAGRRPLFLINVHKTYGLNLAKTIEETWGPEWATTAENLKKLVANPGESLQNMCEYFKDKWCVLCHGDFSMRNMLFHYPLDSAKPDNIKFVDFQTTHYGHFALDLAYLLYGSLRPKLRDENMDTFLKTYFESMRKTCELHGYKGPLPTIEDAKSSLKAMPYFTSINSIMSIPFFIASGKKDVQKKADDWMDAFGTEEVSADFITSQEDIFFNDSEVMEEMKYEVNRMVKENII